MKPGSPASVENPIESGDPKPNSRPQAGCAPSKERARPLLPHLKPAARLSLVAKKKGTKPMIAFLDHEAPPATKRPRPNLLLHCGARAVERIDVQRVTTPRATDTWTPIPLLELVSQVEQTLKANSLVVGTQAHSLSHEGLRYFGLMEIQRHETDEDYCWVLGLRNSHDKTFPAGIIAGSQIFVFDNLAFSGEVKLARKHTTHITRDLPRLVQSAVGKLMERWHHQAPASRSTSSPKSRTAPHTISWSAPALSGFARIS